MCRTEFNPFSACWKFFSCFACWSPWSGQHFYTRKERTDELERLKKRLQDEITAIEEMIDDLRRAQAKEA